MARSTNVGILGIGVYLPPEVRKNDWWPESVVEKWREKRAAPVDTDLRVELRTEGERRIAQAMASVREDPFQGARERRVMPEGMLASHMEKEAATRAIANAGIETSAVDLLLCDTLAPDYLATNQACLLHHNLGLSPRCFSLPTGVICTSFMMQLALAEQMIAGGRATCALLVQTCNITPLLPMEAPFSAWFGDGCTAVIVGKVPEDRGVLAHAHRTYGQFHRTIVASTRTGRWWDEGRVQLFSADPEGARRSFLEIADCAGDVVGTALRDAGCQHGDVDFFAPHQPTSWFREATRGHLGLEGARSLDTFSWAGSLAGANIPLALSVAENEGQLRDGDRVVMFAGGVGLTCAGMVVRWGRG